MDTMNINEAQILKLNFSAIQTKVLQCANILSVPSSTGDSTIYRYETKNLFLSLNNWISFFRFSGQTISNKSLVLITIQLNISQNTIHITINSDQIVLATMLLKDLKQAFSS